jgi:hypothetical protein
MDPFQVERTRRYRRRHAASGLCRKCPAPLSRGGLCEAHWLLELARYERARRRAGQPLRPKRCRACHQAGHNRRTCDRLDKVAV